MNPSSRVILGTVQFGLPYGIANTGGQVSAEEASKVLDLAQEEGIRLLDSAEAYGSSLDVLGHEFRKRGPRFDLLSKFALAEDQSLEDFTSRLERHVREQLERVALPHFWAYSFHRFSDFLKVKDPEPFLKLKREGLVQRWGVSVYSPEEALKAMRSGWVEVIQFPFNVLDHRGRWSGVFAESRRVGVELHSRSVFLQGLFHLSPEKFIAKYPVLDGLAPTLSELQKQAQADGLNLPLVALHYPFFQDEISGVLLGVESADQLRTNLNMLKQKGPKEWEKRPERWPVLADHLLNPAMWAKGKPR